LALTAISYPSPDSLKLYASSAVWEANAAIAAKNGRKVHRQSSSAICEVFELPMSKLVQGLDREGIYKTLEPVLPQRRRRRS
jgi:hypothetical protein